jgi:hypothetical protein
MGTVDLGKISFTQKGTYDNSTSYAPKDVVQHTDQNETSSFVKITSTATGQVPQTNGTLNSSHWQIFAKGTSLASANEGTYNNSTTYQKGDVVQFTDSGTLSTYLYINNTPASGNVPSSGGTVDASHWQFLAKGTASIAISWQSVKTANFNASAAEAYPVNTTSTAITATLPSSPSVGDRIVFRDYNRTWDTNGLTIALNGNNWQGSQAANPVYTDEGGTVDIVYVDATKGWLPVHSVENAVKSQPSIRFLVVAGGGGTGRDNGGGAGAGGFRGGAISDSFNATGSTTYTATVGGGGGGTNESHTNASNSSLAGSGITTITATAGGFGGTAQETGQAGGSGGGGGQGAAGGSGNAGGFAEAEGNDGGTSSGAQAGGAGGGGAGQAGQNCSGSSGAGSVGDGGNGKESNITGSNVFYAGGGGGGSNQANESVAGSGGSGGGGNGSHSSQQGQAGTANTGGGAGGCSQNYSGSQMGQGGSGVVILRCPTAIIASTTGSPTITQVGSDSVVKFTGTGTLVTTSF